MTATGGPPETVSFGGREFKVTGDSDPTIKYGGWQNELEANGDGTARIIKTRVTWSVLNLTIQVDHELGDQEYLQTAADNFTNDVFEMSLASGDIFQGTGQIVGELQSSPAKATLAIGFSGPLKLTKQ